MGCSRVLYLCEEEGGTEEVEIESDDEGVFMGCVVSAGEGMLDGDVCDDEDVFVEYCVLSVEEVILDGDVRVCMG